MPRMDFERDVANEIVRYFDECSVSFDRDQSSDASHLLERYFRFRLKAIDRRPRSVYCSLELQAKLATLEERYSQPFVEIKERFETGSDLSEFLSRLASNVNAADAMLNDFGLHHLHLGAKRSPTAKRVARSDMLLLVMVRPDDAYFVDIRPHPQSSDPDDHGWSHQEYLQIINRNWSYLLDPFELRGVTGDSIPDSGRKELQRKHVNMVTEIDGRAIAPPGGGTTASGANATHRFLADQLLRQLRHAQDDIRLAWEGLRSGFQNAGLQVDDDTELRLVPVRGTTLPEILTGSLVGTLTQSGWMIQHAASGTLLDVGLEWA